MKKTKKSKSLGIIVVAVIVGVVGIAVAIFLLQPKSTPTAVVTSDIPLTDAPELGACQIVTTDNIKKATFGQKIVSITEGVRVGTKGYEGQNADACSYAFSTNKSTDNLLTVAVYNSFVETEASAGETKTGWTELSGTEPRMYFIDGTVDTGEVTMYTLRHALGGNTLLLTIRQPKNEGSFLRAEAIWFLTDVAKSVKTTVIETKNNEQADKAIEGDVPPAPPTNTVKEIGR